MLSPFMGSIAQHARGFQVVRSDAVLCTVMRRCAPWCDAFLLARSAHHAVGASRPQGASRSRRERITPLGGDAVLRTVMRCFAPWCDAFSHARSAHHAVGASRPQGASRSRRERITHKKDQSVGLVFFVVGEDGFEPSKRYAADLQSVPFGHSGTPPYEVGVLSEWSR